jgi:hypothetical protein
MKPGQAFCRAQHPEMDELEALAELLRRHRQDVEDAMGKTASRSIETAEILEKIEGLRVRTEDTLRRYRLSVEAVELLSRGK